MLAQSGTTHDYDCVIIGAGAAGVGCGVIFQLAGINRACILERHEVGASFRLWPQEMRLITPSFPSHGFGILDLNAVAHNTSPGYMFDEEHPTGEQYAHYLATLAEHFELPVQTGVDVLGVESLGAEQGFAIHTSNGTITSTFVVWAAGDFQYPALAPFPGAEHCRHNAQVRSWQEIDGEQLIIIGGYESGIDAAVALTQLGHTVVVIDPEQPWDVDSFDPSVSLSPYTYQRLQQALRSERLQLAGGTRVESVERQGERYIVNADDGRTWLSDTQPILATGFVGSISLATDMFDFSEHGAPLLTAEDESTRMPGFFLIGPAVRHGNLILCFIYKFRQRFAVVASAIATRLGIDPEPLELLRPHGMFLDDLSCCDDTCVC